MKGMHAQTNVAIMARKFQNLNHLCNDIPPPPPESQPPAEEANDAIIDTEAQVPVSSSHFNSNGHSYRSQLHKHQHYSPSEHLNQLVYFHNQPQLPINDPHEHLQKDQRTGQTSTIITRVESPVEKMSGVAGLLNDLQRVLEDHEWADVVFVMGSDEVPVYAHRVLLRAR